MFRHPKKTIIFAQPLLRKKEKMLKKERNSTKMVPSRIELLIFALQSCYFLLARRLNQLGQGTDF
jgi:hypothetical protein